MSAGKSKVQFSSVHSVVSDFATPWTAARQDSLSITNSRRLVKLMSIESVMPSNHLILCRPFLPPSIFPSIRVFSNESGLHIRGPEYWSFSFSINLSNEYSELISFRMDWLDLLAVQGTLKSMLTIGSIITLCLSLKKFIAFEKKERSQKGEGRFLRSSGQWNPLISANRNVKKRETSC